MPGQITQRVSRSRPARDPRCWVETLKLGEEPCHPRLLASRIVLMYSIAGRGFVDGGRQLLGSLSSPIGIAGGDRILKTTEIRLDGRLVAEILQPLPLGDADPLALLLRVSQPLSLPPFFQSRSSLA